MDAGVRRLGDDPGKVDHYTPPDRCPHARELLEGRTRCVAAAYIRVPMADSTGRPLQPVLTCAHLTAATNGGSGFYPKCSLGTAAQRNDRVNAAAPRS